VFFAGSQRCCPKLKSRPETNMPFSKHLKELRNRASSTSGHC
jgi:hypothetical protein